MNHISKNQETKELSRSLTWAPLSRYKAVEQVLKIWLAEAYKEHTDAYKDSTKDVIAGATETVNRVFLTASKEDFSDAGYEDFLNKVFSKIVQVEELYFTDVIDKQAMLDAKTMLSKVTESNYDKSMFALYNK